MYFKHEDNYYSKALCGLSLPFIWYVCVALIETCYRENNVDRWQDSVHTKLVTWLMDSLPYMLTQSRVLINDKFKFWKPIIGFIRNEIFRLDTHSPFLINFLRIYQSVYIYSIFPVSYSTSEYVYKTKFCWTIIIYVLKYGTLSISYENLVIKFQTIKKLQLWQRLRYQTCLCHFYFF